MKSVFIAGIGTVISIALVPFISQVSGITPGWLNNSAIAQSANKQSPLQLYLSGEKQLLTKDEQGKPKIAWEPLRGQVVPGDVLRYTLAAENQSDRQLRNVVLNQPIPQGTVYVMKSINVINVSKPVKITYSIDHGRTFVENPTIPVTQPDGKVVTKPAPAISYTNIRLQVPVIPAKATVKATYETKVR